MKNSLATARKDIVILEGKPKITQAFFREWSWRIAARTSIQRETKLRNTDIKKFQFLPPIKKMQA